MIDRWENMRETLVDAAPSDIGVEAATTLFRQLTGELLANDSLNLRRVGLVFSEWLRDGGDMAAMLGLKPDAGSRVTPQSLVLRDHQDQLLMRLARLAGTDAAAILMLRGELACPDGDLMAEVIRARCPASRAAFTRARQRASRPRL